MGIKTKILAGFIIIGSMLFLSGAIAIYELKTLGNSIHNLLNDNLRSIEISRVMLSASSKMDHGLLMAITGDKLKGERLVKDGEALYQNSFQQAMQNITVKGEAKIVENVKKSHLTYMSLVDSVFNSPILKDVNWYYREFVPAEEALNKSIEDLITVNQTALYKSSRLMEEGTYRAFVPGLIAIGTGIIFVILFNYFINIYFVNPILRITLGVENYVKHFMPFKVKVETDDEISHLKKAIDKLILMDKNNKIAD